MEIALTKHGTSDVEEAAYRKVSLRIMPFLMICYVVAYLDRVNVGFAKLQMLSELQFSEAVYGLGAGIFLSATSSSKCRATSSCKRSAPRCGSPAS
jgi:sugar phosphate permease